MCQGGEIFRDITHSEKGDRGGRLVDGSEQEGEVCKVNKNIILSEAMGTSFEKLLNKSKGHLIVKLEEAGSACRQTREGI